ncbi:putative diguanylate cyclase YedQ [compost metagenome]
MIDDHMQQWLKLQMPFSIIMLDLDHFKAINDEFGHPKGDEVLQFLAQVIQKEVRSGDVCCRLGGEEFMILQPYATEEHAHRIAERIRHTMNQTLSPVGRSVTLSLGIASYPSCAVDKDTLIQIADNALYEAKRRGRNQTVSHSQIH